MASLYVLTRDKLEQVRAILASDALFDAEADHLLDLAVRRLTELDNLAEAGLSPAPQDASDTTRALMPWLRR